MKRINTALILAIFTSCALARSAVDFGRIVGGKDAEKGQFPHQISMRSRPSNAHFCGGSIISTRFILTAGHCTQNQYADPQNVYVVVGALYRLKGGIKMDLDKIVTHQQFSPTFKNDISLLRTTEDIVYSELVQPIALPTERPPVDGGLVVTVSGWGCNTFPNPPQNGDPFPDILQFDTTVTFSLTECKKRVEGTSGAPLFSEAHICTNNPEGRGACFGDSGGPLISNDNKLVGVVSWGYPCATGEPDFYTNVHLYLDWVYGEVAKLGGAIPNHQT